MEGKAQNEQYCFSQQEEDCRLSTATASVTGPAEGEITVDCEWVARQSFCRPPNPAMFQLSGVFWRRIRKVHYPGKRDFLVLSAWLVSLYVSHSAHEDLVVPKCASVCSCAVAVIGYRVVDLSSGWRVGCLLEECAKEFFKLLVSSECALLVGHNLLLVVFEGTLAHQSANCVSYGLCDPIASHVDMNRQLVKCLFTMFTLCRNLSELYSLTCTHIRYV